MSDRRLQRTVATLIYVGFMLFIIGMIGAMLADVYWSPWMWLFGIGALLVVGTLATVAWRYFWNDAK
jgi:VIT1/CCC1 family predicted Fe2+/Mn2+ transporter